MSTPFQNRLVGTIIVAAVAIIFLPDIFDGEKKAYQAQFETIPPSPQTIEQQPIKAFPNEKFERLNQQPPLSTESARDQDLSSDVIAKESNALEQSTRPVASHQVKPETSEQTAQSNTAKPKATKPIESKPKVSKAKPTAIKPVPKSVDKSSAYVIQLGSFKHKKNVEQLVNKLKRNGYTVFTKPIKTAAGNLTKVFIGPQVSESSLQKMLPKLKKLTGVQGRVAIYKPID